MTKVRRLNVSQIEGSDANNTEPTEIRPLGDIAVYVNSNTGTNNDKLELLMFDGIRTHLKSKVLSKGTFYGGDSDSGDGLGFDTIKLIPDAQLHYNGGSYGNDQYIIVDPTDGNPSHIHLRAGGTIDQSNADLFLGGEKNHVKVSDTSDAVVISTDAGFDGQTRTWTFNVNGDLLFPGTTSRIGESEPGLVVYSNNGFAVLTNADTEDTKSWIFDNGGNLKLPAGGDIKYSNGVSVLTPQGEYIHEFTGLNTDLTFTNITFNLLYCMPASGYVGSDTHNVNLPNVTPGQRLVIINISNLCTLTVNSDYQITTNSGPAEFIYTTNDGWFPLYGTVVGP